MWFIIIIYISQTYKMYFQTNITKSIYNFGKINYHKTITFFFSNLQIKRNYVYSINPGARITSYMSAMDMNPSFRAVMISELCNFGSMSFGSQLPYIDDTEQPTSLNKICRSFCPMFQSLKSPSHFRSGQEEVILITVFADNLFPGPLIDNSCKIIISILFKSVQEQNT